MELAIDPFPLVLELSDRHLPPELADSLAALTGLSVAWTAVGVLLHVPADQQLPRSCATRTVSAATSCSSAPMPTSTRRCPSGIGEYRPATTGPAADAATAPSATAVLTAVVHVLPLGARFAAGSSRHR
jgi:hypothetical protein